MLPTTGTGEGMSVGEPSDEDTELRRQNTVLRWVRVLGAAFALVQLHTFQATPGLQVPFPRTVTALTVAGILLGLSLASWVVGRHGSLAVLKRFWLFQVVGDATVVYGLMVLFAFDPGSLAWSLAIIPVLEAALVYRLRGTTTMWLVFSLGFLLREIWAAQTYAHVHLDVGNITYFLGLLGIVALQVGWLTRHLHERTEQYREAQERLEGMVYLDALTRLPNRARLLGTLDRFDEGQEGLAVAFLDLDRFKHVNDTYGHESGDDLLCGLARRLEAAVRPTDMVARLAGDEFVAVFPGLDDRDAARERAQRLARPAAATSASTGSVWRSARASASPSAAGAGPPGGRSCGRRTRPCTSPSATRTASRS
jgi:diguanylate cyclase (GGDEF)-like protein